MLIRSHDSAEEFLDRAGPLLRQSEALNNLILGFSEQLIRTGKPIVSPTKDRRDKKTGELLAPEFPLMLSFEIDEKIVGAAMRTNPAAPLILGGLELGFDESNSDALKVCLTELCHWLQDNAIVLTESLGVSHVSKSFFSVYSEVCGVSGELSMDQGVYENRSVIVPENPANLRLEAFAESDFEIACAYMKGFTKDCFPDREYNDSTYEKLATRRLEDGGLWFLKNAAGEALSMAAVNRETETGSTLSWIYTPDSFRGKGYGSLATAMLSKQELDKGKTHCSLYTDLSNPTSNSIYQKVGYRKVAESQHYTYED